MLSNTVLLAFRSIRRNLARSVLTVLGIVIGVAAVVTMVTLGNGATRAVAEQVASLGSNLLMIMPGQRLGPGRSSAGAPAFEIADVAAIEGQIGALKAVAPSTSTGVTLVHHARNWATSVTGASPAYFAIGNWKLAAGRIFNDAEEKAGKAVCVIGETVRRELFDRENPIDARPRVKTFSRTVNGLLR